MSAVGIYVDAYYAQKSDHELFQQITYYRSELSKCPPLERRKKLIIKIRQIKPILAAKEQAWHNVPIEDNGEEDMDL
jgi:hypothetical protein